MAFNYAPRVTRSFHDVSNALQGWQDVSTRFIVCQHDADAKVKKTHIHLGIWGSDIQEEALKRKFNAHFPAAPLSGNEDWKWKSKKHPIVCKFTNDFIEPSNKDEEGVFQYLKYCIKGDLTRVKMVKNIPTDLLKAAAEAWVEKDNSDKPPEVVFVMPPKKSPTIPYQQLVIADAAAEWRNYKDICKDEGSLPNKREVIKFVCDSMRKHSKGINVFLVRDLVYAVLYDDLDFREIVLQKIISTTYL